MKVLVTGATGNLGTRLLPVLLEAGHVVRGLSRRTQPSGDVEWIVGDLRTGAGLTEAVRGVDAIIHAATESGLEHGKMRMRRAFLHSRKTDVEGTATLLEAAKSASVGHLLYTSIVGIDKVPLAYYRHKVEAENLVRAGGSAHSIARITQFHSLIDALVRYASRFPIAVLPVRSRYQPIDERDAAELLVGMLAREPLGSLVEFGGPEVRTLAELAESWADSRGMRKRFHNVPMPGAKEIAQGALCTSDRSGTITWEQWLKETPS